MFIGNISHLNETRSFLLTMVLTNPFLADRHMVKSFQMCRIRERAFSEIGSFETKSFKLNIDDNR